MTIQTPWLHHYPDGVPHDIQVEPGETLLTLFDAQCHRFAEQPVFLNRGTTLTYAQLDTLSAQLAAYLQTLGLSPGDKVGVMLPNLLQYPVAFFAILRAGLVVVNINPMSPAPELAYLLKNADVRAVIVLANFAHVVEAALPETGIAHVIVTQLGDLLPIVDGMFVDIAAKYIKRLVPPYDLPDAVTWKVALEQGEAATLKPVSIQNDDLALLQYTGATTGHPKGAMLTHQNLLANVKQCVAWVSPSLEVAKERVVVALPLFHIFSLTVACLSFMQLGGCGILITNPRDIKGFIHVLKRQPFSAFVGLDTLFDALMEHKDFEDIDWQALKLVVAGGMPLRESVASRWQAITQTPIITGYGLTEASPVLTINIPDQPPSSASVGLPVPSTMLQIRDNQGCVLTANQPGIVWAKGPQVMRGYWHNDQATQETIDPEGWLNTGDIGTLDKAGFLSLLDRAKDLIIVSGFNVYPAEVDAILAHMPGVKEVAVIGVPHPHTGESVKAFIVKDNTKEAANITRKSVRHYCRGQLLAYKIPGEVVFVSALPKSAVGKVLRRALPGHGG